MTITDPFEYFIQDEKRFRRCPLCKCVHYAVYDDGFHRWVGIIDINNLQQILNNINKENDFTCPKCPVCVPFINQEDFLENDWEVEE